MRDVAFGSLKIALSDEVLAFQLESLLSLSRRTYEASLWLDDMKQLDLPHVSLADFEPISRYELQVVHLIIGTPNWLTLEGKLSALTAVAGILATLIAMPVTMSQHEKNAEEARKTIAETASQYLDIYAKAQKLFEEGRITEEGLRAVPGLDAERIRSIAGTKRLIPEQLPVLSQKDLRPAPTNAERALATIESEALRPLKITYLEAQRRNRQEHSHESQERLNEAARLLIARLPALSHEEFHEVFLKLLGQL